MEQTEIIRSASLAYLLSEKQINKLFLKKKNFIFSRKRQKKPKYIKLDTSINWEVLYKYVKIN